MSLPFSGFYRGKRVLVTGHTGFKGSWLCQWLCRLGARVAGLSENVPPEPCLFQVLGLSKNVRRHFGDIRDPKVVSHALVAEKPEIVFHLAAQPIVLASYKDPKKTFDINVGGTVNLLEALRNAPWARAAVIVTSDKCYENEGKRRPHREGDPLGGRDPYSASKACAEIVARSYARSFFHGRGAPAVATARAGNVIGGGDWGADRVVPDCVRAWSEGRQVVLRNPGYRRPWQHVLDPLWGYLTLGATLARRPEAVAGEPFNFGPSLGSCRTVLDMVQSLARDWPGARWLEAGAKKAAWEAPVLRLDCRKADRLIGWRPALRFSVAVGWTAAWYRAWHEDSGALKALSERQLAQYETSAAVSRQRM